MGLDDAGIAVLPSTLETKGFRPETTFGWVEGGGEGFGCELVGDGFGFSVVHVDVRGWAVGA